MLGFLGVELLFQSPIVGDPCVGSRKSPWLMACCDPPPSWWGLRGSGRTWMNSNGENSNSPRHITRTSPCASTDPWAVSTTWDVFFRPLFSFLFVKTCFVFVGFVSPSWDEPRIDGLTVTNTFQGVVPRGS